MRCFNCVVRENRGQKSFCDCQSADNSPRARSARAVETLRREWEAQPFEPIALTKSTPESRERLRIKMAKYRARLKREKMNLSGAAKNALRITTPTSPYLEVGMLSKGSRAQGEV